MIKKILIAINWRVRNLISVIKWELNKTGIPPHSIKQRMIKTYKNRYTCNVFIETGTFKGYMVKSMLKQFKIIHSIELNETFFKNAKKLFNDYKYVKIWQGNSEFILPIVLENIRENSLFWLDGHCCIDHGKITSKGIKNTPIISELISIANNQKKYDLKHLILIDDARLFDGNDDYPTIDEIKKLILDYYTNYKVIIKNDIIACYPF